MEKVEFMNMCMIQDGSKVLVINRQAKAWPGIAFPGGHVEYGESFSTAVIREIKEETGLNIKHPQLCGINNWLENDVRYVVLFYRTKEFEGELQSSDEGEVWWEELDNLPNLNLSLDMVDMIKVFIDDSISEFHYRQEDGRWIYDLM